MKFEGVIAAMVTPFTKDNEIDEEGLKRNIEFLERNGIDAILPCGTTGESPTLSHDEHKEVIKITTDAAHVPVLAGTGSNSTKETIDLSIYADDVGADGVLIVTPYYNKPNETGLIKHFETVVKKINIPIIMYNIPSRTGLNMSPSQIARLADIEGIDGIKEASGNISQVSQIIELTKDKDFYLLSGNDDQTLPILSLGGKGVISVAANIIPKELKEMYDSFVAGDIERAREIHYNLSPLFKALFIETNPIPIKAACNMMRLAAGDVRLPLANLSREHEDLLKTALKKYLER